MKVSILLSGNIRTWDKTKYSFAKFFSGIDYDLHVDTYSLRYMYHPAVAASLPGFSDQLLDQAEIEAMMVGFPLKSIIVRDPAIVDDISRKSFAPAFSGLHHNCFLPVSNASESIARILDESTDSCDFLVKTRFDAVYKGRLAHSFPPEVNSIYVTSGNVWPSDWFFAGSPALMQELFSKVKIEFFTPRFSGSHHDPPHGLYRSVLIGDSIDVVSTRFVKGLLRKDGLVDNYVPPNWFPFSVFIRAGLNRVIRSLGKRFY